MTPGVRAEQVPARRRARSWTGRRRGGVAGNWAFTALVRSGGLWPAYALLAFVAAYFVAFAPAARRASAAYRRRIGFRQGSWPSRLWGAYCHFFRFGQILLDRYAFASGHADWFRFEFIGEAHVRSALARGKGVILISAHCGNWEAAGHFLRALDVPVNIVGYEGERADIRSVYERAGSDRLLNLVNADGSLETVAVITAALRRGEVVAMLADRLLDESGVVVPFLGAPARFPGGPYVLAALSGAPLIHAFAMREGMRRYRVVGYPPEEVLAPDEGGCREAVREHARRFVARLESVLREHPLQWHNFFDFWRDDEEGVA